MLVLTMRDVVFNDLRVELETVVAGLARHAGFRVRVHVRLSETYHRVLPDNYQPPPVVPLRCELTVQIAVQLRSAAFAPDEMVTPALSPRGWEGVGVGAEGWPGKVCDQTAS